MKYFYLLILLYLCKTILSLKISPKFPSPQCKKHGIFYYNQCYCFSQYQGEFCNLKKAHGWYQSESKCQQMLKRLDNLLNINPDHYLLDDDEFPRLTGDSIGDTKQAQKTSYQLWIKMHDASKKFKIFGQKISSDQIQQGNLGNCYFLATLSSFANIRNGELIKEMFLTQEENKKNIYVTKWLIQGKPRFVAVDEWIPRKNFYSNKLFFSRVTDQQVFWAIILEKAWAKIFGQYFLTESGQTNEIYGAIVHQNEEFSIFNDKEYTPQQIYDQIKTIVEQQYPITAYTYPDIFYKQQEGKSKKEQKLKLVSQHTYSILDAFEVDRFGIMYKLIKIFNPWNKEIWLENPWASNGDMWEGEMIEKYQIKQSNGIFYLDPKDFYQQFARSSYSIIQKNYEIIWQDIPFQEQQEKYYAEFLVKNNEQQFLEVSLAQISDRFKKNFQCKSLYRYKKQSLTVYTPQKTIFNDIKNQKKVIILNPKPGKFRVELQLLKNQNYQQYFTINVYGQLGQIEFLKRNDIINEENQIECPNGCNGQGRCNTFDGKCLCYYGYNGNDCSQKIKLQCYNNCNGNGKCKFGKCFCKPGFFGEECYPCEDLDGRCKNLKENHKCNIYSDKIQFMYQNCQKTCADAGYKNFQCYQKNDKIEKK